MPRIPLRQRVYSTYLQLKYCTVVLLALLDVFLTVINHLILIWVCGIINVLELNVEMIQTVIFLNCHYVLDLRREGALWNGSRCLSVCPFVCHVPWTNSRMEKLRKPKIGRMEAHHTGNLWTYLEVKRSRLPGWLCLFVHTIEPKLLKLQSPNLPQG